MPAKRVLLDPEQRDSLVICPPAKHPPENSRVRILLKADESQGSPAYADKQIREAVEVSLSTTRKTFVLEGLTAAVTPKKRSRASRQKFDGEKEAHLIV